MDHDFAALVDEFEQVARSIRADDKPSVWVLTDVLDRQRVLNGVLDVEIVDAMRRAEEWISTREYRATQSRQPGRTSGILWRGTWAVMLRAGTGVDPGISR